MFEFKQRAGLARVGKLYTEHGVIETPALLPVINPNKVVLSPKDLGRLGASALITNAYIIWKNTKLREEALGHGVHKLLNYKGPIMTDSGAFQIAQYGRQIDALKMVEFQCDLGADICTVLDVITPPGAGYDQAKQDIALTLERAKEAKKLDVNLAITAQGGTYPRLRERAAKQVAKLKPFLAPIGGAVPLLESYRYADLANIILWAKRGLKPSIPVHLFGCGHPIIFPLAVLLGCDLFDSAAYAKYARGNRLLFPEGTKKLENLRHLPCSCSVCSTHTVEDLSSCAPAERERKIAEHNLQVSFTELKKIKNAVVEGRLWELVERRCRAHPNLLPVLKVLRRHRNYLEKFEPLSSYSFFYVGKESLWRPIAYRYRKRLMERYKPNGKLPIVLEDDEKPYSETYKEVVNRASTDHHLIVSSPFGPVPLELDLIYPIAQSVVPRKRGRDRFLITYLNRFDTPAIYWERGVKLQSDKGKLALDKLRVKAVGDVQFGKGVGEYFIQGRLEFTRSKTGRIREVRINGKHVLTMRSDGFFTLTKHGAKLLHHKLPPPNLRVTIAREAVRWVKEGKSVFAKFVLDCDPSIRPGDEALVVTEEDILVAQGKTLMRREEMLSFQRGVAVRPHT